MSIITIRIMDLVSFRGRQRHLGTDHGGVESFCLVSCLVKYEKPGWLMVVNCG